MSNAAAIAVHWTDNNLICIVPVCAKKDFSGAGKDLSVSCDFGGYLAATTCAKDDYC